MLESDVVVCGGGPAGLAAAIACRMQGLTVAVAACDAPPVDKACGEGLLPEAMTALGQLGLDMDTVPSSPLHGISFLDGDTPAVQGRFQNGLGCGVKRTELHGALCRRAEQSGAELRWNTYVTALKQTGDAVEVSTRTGPLRARWCIGADGLQSQVRKWSGLDRGASRSIRTGLRRHYAIARWSSLTEVYWGRFGQAYVTPIAHNEVGLALINRARGVSYDTMLEEFPQLRNRLRDARYTGTIRGALTSSRRLPRVTTGRVALLGDASGSVDAITGAGLSLAFRQALAVGHAIRNCNLNDYENAHREIGRTAALLSSVLLGLDQFPALRRVAFASFRSKPHLFETMLALHSGAVPFAYWGSNGAFALGLQALLG